MFFVNVDSKSVHRLGFRPKGDAVYLVEEIDSTRIISNKWSDVLEPVSPILVELQTTGSVAPVTALFDSRDAFDAGDSEAEKFMRGLVDNGTLDDAVKQCCLAATSEYNYEAQKALLRAASYGKSFSGNTYANELKDDFRNAHNKLRILNNLRDVRIGIPLTSTQYDTLTPAVIVQRLCACKQHFLAAKICKLLGMSNAKVLTHWAYLKIASNTSLDDDKLCSTICRVFQLNNAAVSYASVARQANELGKRDLAIKLLQSETQVDEKVGLLLVMDDYDRALKCAVRSQNSDHIFTVLMRMRKRAPDGSLFTKKILTSYPAAADLLVLFLQKQQELHGNDGNYRENDRALLRKVRVSLPRPCSL